MSEVFKQWLKNNLDQMVSVQSTYLHIENADLVILSWKGVKVDVHLIRAPPRTRNLKRILQNASSQGTNSLFLVEDHLLPSDGQRVLPKEWMLMLQMLTGERIYTYRGTQPEIFQVHFDPINNASGEHQTWYGPTVTFKQLRYFRTSIRKPRALKGDWLVADFGCPVYWRNSSYRAQQATTATKARTHRETTWQTWSNYASESSMRLSAMQDHLTSCCRLLGVQLDTPREEVKRAFRRKVISLHPDTTKLPPKEAETMFHDLQQAYNYIKAAKGWQK